MDTTALFHAARYNDETQGQYRQRRKEQKRYLKRKVYAFISSNILRIPPKGVDAEADRLIEQGKIRDVLDTTALDSEGRRLRVGREKGTTYVKEKK